MQMALDGMAREGLFGSFIPLEERLRDIHIIPPKAKVINIATRLRNIVVEVVSML
jgi:hypothetical protein